MTQRRLRRAAALVALACALSACGTLSVEEEKKLGAEYQQQLRKQLTFVRDPVSVTYVRQFGSSLAAAARPSPFEFRFYLVEDEEINAFAIPGGAVYVNTGLLLAVHNGAELAGVLGHEMGHVTARHIAKNANTQRNTGFVANIFYLAVAILTGNPYLANAGGLAGQVAGQAFMTTFTRDAEREADLLGVETMTNAGWNPNAMVTMFETLKKEGGHSSMPQFLASHPATDERIQNVRKEIEKYPNSDTLRLDDPKLPIIQERLKLIIGTDREKEDKSDDESDDKK
ncbi:MAG: M48 family metallopeptidase [Myxococcota bacterium]